MSRQIDYKEVKRLMLECTSRYVNEKITDSIISSILNETSELLSRVIAVDRCIWIRDEIGVNITNNMNTITVNFIPYSDRAAEWLVNLFKGMEGDGDGQDASSQPL